MSISFNHSIGFEVASDWGIWTGSAIEWIPTKELPSLNWDLNELPVNQIIPTGLLEAEHATWQKGYDKVEMTLKLNVHNVAGVKLISSILQKAVVSAKQGETNVYLHTFELANNPSDHGLNFVYQVDGPTDGKSIRVYNCYATKAKVLIDEAQVNELEITFVGFKAEWTNDDLTPSYASVSECAYLVGACTEFSIDGTPLLTAKKVEIDIDLGQIGNATIGTCGIQGVKQVAPFKANVVVDGIDWVDMSLQDLYKSQGTVAVVVTMDNSEVIEAPHTYQQVITLPKCKVTNHALPTGEGVQQVPVNLKMVGDNAADMLTWAIKNEVVSY